MPLICIPGFKKIFSHNTKLIQLTLTNCPPILGVDFANRPNCKESNQAIFERIKNEKPDRVILSASWYSDAWRHYNWRLLGKAIRQLQGLGLARIDLVGPVPIWHVSLPKVLVSYHSRNDVMPERLSIYNNAEALKQLDQSMYISAKQWNINYISALKILCNSQGCLTMSNNEWSSLTAWGHGHLTTKGSEYLVSLFPK